MSLKIVLIFLMLAIMTSGCKKTNTAETQIKWEFNTVVDEMETPKTSISIRINGNSAIPVYNGTGEYSEIERSLFSEHAVPDNALSACSGFWAGFQHILYVVRQDQEIVLMSGGIDEGEEAEYTYQESKRFPLQ